MPHDSLSLQAAFKYLFVDEVHALKQLAQSLPSNPVVVNIGAGAGTSGLAFMESRDDLELITIDIQKEDSPLGSLYSEEMILRSTNLWNSRVHHIHNESMKVGKLWQQLRESVNSDKPFLLFIANPPMADMVFIDGDHSYNGCKGDILAWLPNIKSGGIMAVHDFEKRKVFNGEFIEGAPHPLPWPGVDRAVRKFLCPNYEMILKVQTLVAFRIDK